MVVFVQCFPNGFRRKRFQYVIDTIGVEGVQRVFVIGCAEYDGYGNINGFEYFKAQTIAKLNIAEYKIGLSVPFQVSDGFFYRA